MILISNLNWAPTWLGAFPPRLSRYPSAWVLVRSRTSKSRSLVSGDYQVSLRRRRTGHVHPVAELASTGDQNGKTRLAFQDKAVSTTRACSASYA